MRTAVVLPDTHFPFEDRLTWSAVERYIADSQPDEIVQLGDLGDFDQVSRFTADEPERLVPSLAADYDYIEAKLDKLQALAPKAEITILEGNHDNRIERLIRRFPQLRGTVDLPIRLHLAERGIRWVPYWSEGKLHQIGHAFFAHGRYLNKYHAWRMVDNYGVPIFYGHTHDVMSFPKVLWAKGLAIIGQSLGCLCSYDQEYIQGAPTNWQQAFGVFRFRADGSFNHYVVRIFDHSFVSPESVEYKPDRRVKPGPPGRVQVCRA